MKRLIFEELALLSVREGRARRIPLHPSATVIKGDNGTGKSCLIKSLYLTLGAEPPNIHPRWQGAQVVSSLRFTLDGVRYRALRHGARHALFDQRDALIGSYAGITTELAPAIARLFNFHLLLQERGGGERQATPAFLFLPFYLDQDQGWTAKLASFMGLQQFPQPKPSVVDFHFGIRPSEYYQERSQLADLDRQAAELRPEREALQGVLDDLDRQLGAVRLSTSIRDYQAEVERLLTRSQELAAHEDQLRERMTESYTTLSACRDQLHIAKAALDEARADREFSAGLGSHSVHCPTCHAEYQNGFAERFSIAADEDQLIDLIGRLGDQARSAERDYQRTLEDSEEARTRFAEIDAILQTTRQQVALRDVLRSEGKREVIGVMRERLTGIDARLGELEARKTAVRARMREYEGRERRQRIEARYRDDMGRLLERLGITNLPPASYQRPAGLIRETGSALSRAILAFFLASARTIDSFSTCAMCPLVVDSPRQQDQDDANWIRVRECLRDDRPENSQLILATSDDGDTAYGGDVIELRRQGQLLETDQFHEVADELRPLIDASLNSDSPEQIQE